MRWPSSGGLSRWAARTFCRSLLRDTGLFVDVHHSLHEGDGGEDEEKNERRGHDVEDEGQEDDDQPFRSLGDSDVAVVTEALGACLRIRHHERDDEGTQSHRGDPWLIPLRDVWGNSVQPC